MKVKILSGNQTGQVVEMRQDEAEIAIATGFGVKVEDPKKAKTAKDDAKDAKAAAKDEKSAAKDSRKG